MLKGFRRLGLVTAVAAGLSVGAQAGTIRVDYTGDNWIQGFWTVDSDGTKESHLNASTDTDGNFTSSPATDVSAGDLKDWRQPSTQYIDLAPGTYTFYFRAVNQDRVEPGIDDTNPAAFLAAISGAVADNVFSGTAWETSESVDRDDGDTKCEEASFETCSTWTAAVLTDGWSGSDGDNPDDASFGGNNRWDSIGHSALDAVFTSASEWIWDANGEADYGSTELFLRTNVTVVPIPQAAVFFLTGAVGVALVARNRRRREAASEKLLPA